MNNMTLGKKISLAFGLVIVLTAILSWVSYSKLTTTAHIYNEITENRLPSIIELSSVESDIRMMMNLERYAMNRRVSYDVREEQFKKMEDLWKAVEEASKKFEALPATKEEEKIWGETKSAIQEWYAEHNKIVDKLKERNRLTASGIGGDDKAIADLDQSAFEHSMKATSHFDDLSTHLVEVIDLNIKIAADSDIEADKTRNSAKSFIIFFSLFIVILSIFVAFFISKNINNIVKSMIGETDALVTAAVDGKLATRGNVESTNFEFQPIVLGFNKVLDAVIGPLNVAADYVDKISRGNIPAKITDTYNGDFNTIKNNLNTCIDAVNSMTGDAAMLSKAAVEGKLATRADASKHQGDFRKIVQGVNETLDSVIGPLNVAANYVDRISNGDIPAKITDNYNGDFNTIKNNLNKCIDAVNSLVADANILSKAAIEGKLATRADATKHQGDFRKIVQGVNETLDAVIGPLNVAAGYVDRISNGDIPTKITDSYNGDFNTIKNNLNKCVDAVNSMVGDAAMLSKAAVEGKLATRADASKHQGDFRKIVQGVNDTLDSVIGPLNVAAGYVDRISNGDIPTKITDNYNGDFNTIKNNLNKCIDAVNSLVADANTLSQAAIDGRLATRADASKHQGDFRKIVQGVNDTLDAVIEPINEAKRILQNLSHKDFSKLMEGTYKGDHAVIKESMNETIDSINYVLQEVLQSTDQVVSGADQVAGASQALSSGASEQASSVEELSASMQELSSQTKLNAENAVQASKLAVATKDTAEHGNSQMRDMIRAMEEINEASQEITKVVKMIDDIAFQTNLLALNAAVEAARAGVHGKGFAVVANEVRNLAQRSAKATKDTTELVEKTVKRVEKGSKIAEETGRILADIVGNVTKVTDFVEEISSASNEQATGINQASAGLGQVSQVTQQVAANSEESAAASEELSGQAEQLKHILSQFKLKQQFNYNSQSSSQKSNVKKQIGQAVKAKSTTFVKPEEVISLDDKDFTNF